ncbi:hypothetical protein IJH15_02625 [Candidatus Saccharibacteria bacterium]|nr:hypothetical protein [Candidatus Saccharibacteria bacterium]MBR3253198.1 hypothetical protein [Candidatus Saccharibacteria bacterium]
MAKEVAIGKRAKISEAQQYMLFAVLGASLFLGVAISLVSHFVKQISFNTEVIMAQDQAIDAYSDVIKNVGVCKSPRGRAYTGDELKNCNPNSINVSEISGTLRANILNNLAADQALNTVPKDSGSSCINSKTKKNYTYEELNEIYNKAAKGTEEELVAASQLIKSCSALRIIPDALPAFKNEEALLASLNKLFLLSGREPETLSPSGTIEASDLGTGLNAVIVNLSIEDASTKETIRLLTNIERSIREFNINTLTLSWSGSSTLSLRGQATAFYRDESSIVEVNKIIQAEDE